MIVFSNSCGASDFDPQFKLAEEFERLNSDIKVLRHGTKKPNGISNVLKHFDGMAPSDIAFVGDRLLTDVLMANEAGLFSILVTEPLTVQGDNLPAVFIRYLERKLLGFLDRRQ